MKKNRMEVCVRRAETENALFLLNTKKYSNAMQTQQ